MLAVRNIKPLSIINKAIMELMATGHTMREIALKVFLNIRTIEKHLEDLRHQYGARNTTHLVSILVFNRLLLIDKNNDKIFFKDESAHDLRIHRMVDLRKNINKLLNTYQDNL